MKVNQAKPEFRPVTITLETQDEVNALYALFNSTVISHVLLNEFFGTGAWELLGEFKKEPQATHLHTRLVALLKDPR